MLADFCIHTLEHDMKFVVWKNYLGGQFVYRSLVPPIKNGVFGKTSHSRTHQVLKGTKPAILDKYHGALLNMVKLNMLKLNILKLNMLKLNRLRTNE